MSDLILGVDIGGTKSAVVLGTADGEIIARRSEPTLAETGPDAIMARLVAMAREILASEHVETTPPVPPSQGGGNSGSPPLRRGGRGGGLSGIGISCGGPLDTKTGLVYSPPNLPGWNAVPARRIFEEAFPGLPVILENDANATALAEWRFGAGRGTTNMAFLTMGTGIGGGLILDGRLYHGTNDLAGEVGHQTILINGPLCGCGKRGCLEALASGPAIARLAQDSLQYGRGHRLVEIAGGKPGDVTAKHVIEAAKEGEALAVKVLEEAGTYMGIGLANLIQILNPERIVLGTIAVHAGDLILEPIRRAVAEFAWERARSVCEIVPAALGDRAQDLAAISLLG
jgi:glucokinase